ncbi:hypothetical protein [Thiomicrospira sp. WB1]|uniref:hypothetical protein n=1 Tax=Thiomicrospira sp. WB1 TaxID=1685380 RepID=UPI000A6B27FC|nr:hypothetical protein [Thiomicrospira sp. WB1]
MLWLGSGLALLSALVSPSAWALLVHSNFSEREILMGEAVEWRLTGPDVQSEAFNQAWSKLDWAPIREHFYVASIRQRGTGLAVRLLPYRTGEVILPDQAAAAIPLPSQPLWVAENPAMGVDWQICPECDGGADGPWYARQVLRWQARIDAAEDGWTVQIHPPDGALMDETPKALGWQWPSSPQGLPTVMTDAGQGGQLSLGRSLPNQTDSPRRMRFQGPLLMVRNERAQNWTFAAPPATGQVRPLPGFLPWSIPVGRIALQTSGLPWLLSAGDQYHWQFTLTGHQLPADALPSLAQQMQGDEAIEWLSAQVDRQQTWDENGLSSRALITQPLRIHAWGPVTLPTIRAQAFDPITGRLQSTQQLGETVWVLPGWLVWTLYGLSGLLSLAILGWIGYVFVGLWAYLRLRWQLKRAVRAQRPDETIWTAVQAWSKYGLRDWEEGQSASPLQWLTAFEEKRGHSPEARAWISCLNQCRYARSDQRSVACEALVKTCQAWSKTLPWMGVIRLRR